MNDEVLEFWFGALDAAGSADAAHAARWFRTDVTFDDAIRARFGNLHAALARSEHEDWLDTPSGRLAYVIVLDQFSRNLYRGTAQMFAYDARALAASVEGLARGDDARLAHDERMFLYMPLMHSEARDVQARCVALFTQLRDAAAPELRERDARTLEIAQRHRDIVDRFGRFPHRNELLGRASTTEETIFLATPGSSFLSPGALSPRQFPDWNALYEREAVERMPWYFEGLDPDVARAIETHAIGAGRALDLGTGPGTQAIALAARGFDVTATDIAPAALAAATERAGALQSHVHFVRDDILQTKLRGPFDLILDRGCFHVLEPSARAAYVRTVHDLLAPDGRFLLKCFSEEQPGTNGPYRFAPEQIREIFEPHFVARSIERTVYQGTLDPPPRALFSVLSRR